MQINELAYDAAVKFLSELPKDCAEYKAFKTMQLSHDIWKRAATDLIARAEKMQDKLDKINPSGELASVL